MSPQGVYVCMTKGCEGYNAEVRHPYDSTWPLEQRQHKCSKCDRRMLLVAVKHPMSEEAKAKLRELVARRKERP